MDDDFKKLLLEIQTLPETTPNGEVRMARNERFEQAYALRDKTQELLARLHATLQDTEEEIAQLNREESAELVGAA